jgi:hypothetical protein
MLSALQQPIGESSVGALAPAYVTSFLRMTHHGKALGGSGPRIPLPRGRKREKKIDNNSG